jgi:hypothetical protein
MNLTSPLRHHRCEGGPTRHNHAGAPLFRPWAGRPEVVGEMRVDSAEAPEPLGRTPFACHLHAPVPTACIHSLAQDQMVGFGCVGGGYMCSVLPLIA